MQAEAQHKSCLHLVVKSASGALDGCRSQFKTGDSILFLDDGVMHVPTAAGGSLGLPATACYFAGADLEARALLGLCSGSTAQILTDQAIVELMLSHELCLTWK